MKLVDNYSICWVSQDDIVALKEAIELFSLNDKIAENILCELEVAKVRVDTLYSSKNLVKVFGLEENSAPLYLNKKELEFLLSQSLPTNIKEKIL